MWEKAGTDTPVSRPDDVGIGVSQESATNNHVWSAFGFFRINQTPDFDLTA